MSEHKGLRAKVEGRGRIIGLGAAIAAVVALVVTGSAVAGSGDRGTVSSADIINNEVRSPDIMDGGIYSPDIQDGKVRQRDLAPFVQTQLGKVPTRFRTSGDPITVTDVGGTFGKFTETVRATQLDTITLGPGRWVVDADGFFTTNAADAARDVRMQLALRIDDGTDWGVDVGTAFTGLLSPHANREATVHTTRVVKLDEPTDVLVYAFGYEDDEGSGASGQVDAASYVTAQRVG